MSSPMFSQNVVQPKLSIKQIKDSAKSYKKQKSLRPIDIEKSRNSVLRQLSVDMICQGYHKSFRELCSILKGQKKDRNRLGAEHPQRHRPLLDAETDKLRYLCKCLNKAEEAEQKKQYSNMYTSYREIASYFVKSEDYWLSDDYHKKCLAVVQTFSPVDSKYVSEAYCNVGIVYERRGNFFKALKYYEKYRELSKDYDDFKVDANHRLTHLYIKISGHCNESDALQYIIKAYKASKHSDDKSLENDTCYKLGRAYLEREEIDSALKYFHRYYDSCQKENDNQGFVRASEALAICYQKQRNQEKTSEYLNRCLRNVSNVPDHDEYAQACSTFGFIQTTLGHYDSAIESTSKGYSVALANNSSDLNRNRVLYGMANGLKLRSTFMNFIDQMKVRDLIEWKSTRMETYSKKLKF